VRQGHLFGVVVVAALLAAACSSDDGSRGRASRVEAAPAAGPSGGSRTTSIVQLGDSVASGEGTLYGYTYDASSDEWTGGNIDASWPPPYPDCHDSPDAYGQVVATYFGATFHQFACTGATFASGISAPETSDGTTLRPAEFGNWGTTPPSDVNPDYDRANPDLVLITLGADDVRFVPIVEACVKNGYEYYLDLADLECVPGNPGSTIEDDFFDFLPKLEANYGTLVDWIEDRAKSSGLPTPKIVFTNYANPLPPKGTKCPDTSWLYPKQVQYLSSIVGEMNERIVSTIEGLDNDDVAVVDISDAYQPAGVDHRWCTDAPWAYGLSIYKVTDPFSFESQAPFHPTPQGQDSIAALVNPAVSKLFGAPLLSEGGPTGTTPPATTTTKG
jgi:lysophospholipase L1-like esterase